MEEEFVKQVYDAMMGWSCEKPSNLEVESAFGKGKPCEELYAQIYDANRRICDRFGVEEDPDVETIINAFFEMTERLCCQMYFYGIKYEKERK